MAKNNGIRVACAGIFSTLAIGAILSACSSAGGTAGSGFASGGVLQGGAAGSAAVGGASAAGGGGGLGGFGALDGGGGSSGSGNVTTCEEAARAKSYVGCDFWPTVVPNNVWGLFDYAVVVANAGNAAADVQVMLGTQQVATDQVPPNGLKKIYLRWIPALKGPDTDACGTATPVSSSIVAPGGAYHLVSSVPVSVYQFNALEYRGAGGPSGKNWNACPGNQTCQDPNSQNFGSQVGCFSFSNDASLLLPSTAMTGNYRIAGTPGWPTANISSYFAVTGTQNGTTVNVKVATPRGQVAQGGSQIPATGPGQTVTVQLNAGDVALFVSPASSDLSGSLVQATQPVQVIHGIPCITLPVPTQQGDCCCDHIEESVFPAETLGKHYFVTVPTSPGARPVGHIVRMYGNVDGTTLSYPAGVQPPGAPATLNAGQVVDLGVISQNFEVSGNHEFAVNSFSLRASSLGGGVTPLRGDPDVSSATAVEQYRTKYVFLAPDDYDENYVDVIMPMDAAVTIDGSAAGAAPTAIGSSGFGVARVRLGPGTGGAHLLTSTKPVGIQVMGYGSYTSYHYPGGSDLNLIAPPPVR